MNTVFDVNLIIVIREVYLLLQNECKLNVHIRSLILLAFAICLKSESVCFDILTSTRHYNLVIITKGIIYFSFLCIRIVIQAVHKITSPFLFIPFLIIRAEVAGIPPVVRIITHLFNCGNALKLIIGNQISRCSFTDPVCPAGKDIKMKQTHYIFFGHIFYNLNYSFKIWAIFSQMELIFND